MIKPLIIDFRNKKSSQEREEINMTPEQRIELTFQLIDLSIALTPSKELSQHDDAIQWIDLHLAK